MTSRPKESEKRQPSPDKVSKSQAQVGQTGIASRARGERPVWHDERVKAVCARIAEGTFIKHACALEGASYIGLHDAAKSDPEIARQVEAAQATGAEMYRAELRMTLGDWKREAWFLERWDRDTFKPPKAEVESKNEHAGPGGSALTLTIDAATAHALAKLPREPK